MAISGGLSHRGFVVFVQQVGIDALCEEKTDARQRASFGCYGQRVWFWVSWDDVQSIGGIAIFQMRPESVSSYNLCTGPQALPYGAIEAFLRCPQDNPVAYLWCTALVEFVFENEVKTWADAGKGIAVSSSMQVALNHEEELCG